MLSTGNSYASDSVNDQTMPFPSDGLCFPHRVPIALCRRAVARMHLPALRLKDSLSELSETQLSALGQLLPSLLCGEESAFHVFWREGERLSNVQLSHSKALANQIAIEELEHERLTSRSAWLLPRSQRCREHPTAITPIFSADGKPRSYCSFRQGSGARRRPLRRTLNVSKAAFTRHCTYRDLQPNSVG